MNEIYKKKTTIKSNKLKFQKVLKKKKFLSQKLIFQCLNKDNFLKKVVFFYLCSHERSELPAHDRVYDFVYHKVKNNAQKWAIYILYHFTLATQYI